MIPATASVLVIDQSTAATKGFLFDETQRLRDKVAIEHRQHFPERGRVEHDALEIVGNARNVIGQILDRHAASPLPAALSIANQRETVVAWDRISGLPFGRAIVWQDQRGVPICENLVTEGLSKLIMRKTGLLVDPFFSASKLATLVREDGAAAAALRAGRLMAGTMDSWLIWNLTERRTFATDWSNAGRTMLFDIEKLRWDEELLALFGLRGLLLPEPRCSDSGFGELRLSRGRGSIPIAGVMGDSHAALFGHRGWHPGDAKATYGTGTSVMLNIGDRPCPPPQGIVLSIGWGLRGRPTYVFEGNIHSSGDTLVWLRDKLRLFSSLEEAEAIATGLSDSGGVHLVPAFAGLGAPHWEHGIGALITGLSRDSGREQVIRAGMESIAFQVRDLVQVMGEASSPFTFLHADGGATDNAFLMQFQADVLGIPVLVPAEKDLSAFGAALMAGAVVGVYEEPGADQASTAMDGDADGKAREFRPAKAEPERLHLIEGWTAAVRQAIAGKREVAR